MNDLLSAYRFFSEHAGWSTPPGKACCALAYARAERDARTLGYTFAWTADPEPSEYQDHKGRWHTDYDAEMCEIIDPDGRCTGSLRGIIGATPAYRRVIEAELASEAIAREAVPSWQI